MQTLEVNCSRKERSLHRITTQTLPWQFRGGWVCRDVIACPSGTDRRLLEALRIPSVLTNVTSNAPQTFTTLCAYRPSMKVVRKGGIHYYCAQTQKGSTSHRYMLKRLANVQHVLQSELILANSERHGRTPRLEFAGSTSYLHLL